MEQTEAAAIDRAKAGDGEAFRLLVERHSRSVFRLAYRMTGNEQDAEDVVQETFLRAFKQLERFDHRAQFGTWLYRIATNLCLDRLRSRKRYADIGDEENPDPMAQVQSGNPGPDRLALSGQLRDSVNLALDSLSAQERTAFVLRHYEGLPVEQIGATLGIGENAAKNSIFRAVQKLRRSLAPFLGSTA